MKKPLLQNADGSDDISTGYVKMDETTGKKITQLRKSLTENPNKGGFASIDEHRINIIEVRERFPHSNINLEQPTKSAGLSAHKAAELLAINGPNSLTPPKTTPAIIVFLRQFLNVFMLLLSGAGALSTIAYFLDRSQPLNLYLGLVLFALVLVSCISSFKQELTTSKVMDTFKKMMPAQCAVIRDGRECRVQGQDLVVGDIVLVNGGDKVPADLRILDNSGLKVECSSITGESEPLTIKVEPAAPNLPSNEARNLAWSGSLALEGKAIGVVIRTGDNTVIGQIASQASDTTTRPTTLQIELSRFVKFIAILALSMGAVFFVIGVGRQKGHGILNVLINGFLIIVVANVPQGLPATVTSLLTVVAQRLAAKNVFVKKLEGVETLGSTSMICSDKTGTLTENVMTCTAIWTEGDFVWDHFEDLICTHEMRQQEIAIAGGSGRSNGGGGQGGVENRRRSVMQNLEMRRSTLRASLSRRPSATGGSRVSVSSAKELEAFGERQPVIPANALQELYVAACVCNNANIEVDVPIDWTSRSSLQERARDLKITGSPSEIALLRWCEAALPCSPTRTSYNVVFEIPFNSSNKWHLLICINQDKSRKPPGAQREYILYLKGAPEKVLDLCTSYYSKNAELQTDEAFRHNFNTAYERFGSQGQRVLGICKKRFVAPTDIVFDAEKINFPMKDLCFLGLTAITDPPRREVPEAVLKCQSAGIRVAMVTGDHRLTACAIARQVNILPQDSVSGVEDVDAQTARVMGLSPCVARFHDKDWAFVEGPSVDGLTQADWDHLLEKTSLVFARVTPNHKFMIVEQCQQHGEIVAVTGDGVNDAPALKVAHIGVSMGKNGSDVAREASDVVLMDDNFASIVMAIEQGRLIFDNLMKTISYTLTHLTPEIVPVFLSIALGLPTPLTSLEILSIDLGTELGPAISLAYEPKESDIMEKPPRDTLNDRLVSPSLLFYAYCLQGLTSSGGAMFGYFLAYLNHGLLPTDIFNQGDSYFPSQIDSNPNFCPQSWKSLPDKKPTWIKDNVINQDGDWCYDPSMQLTIAADGASSWYIIMVTAQIFHIWSVKARRVPLIKQGLLNNTVTIFGVFIEILILIVVVYVPGVQGILGTTSVGYFPWIIGAATGLVTVFNNEMRKYIAQGSENRFLQWFLW